MLWEQFMNTESTQAAFKWYLVENSNEVILLYIYYTPNHLKNYWALFYTSVA